MEMEIDFDYCGNKSDEEFEREQIQRLKTAIEAGFNPYEEIQVNLDEDFDMVGVAYPIAEKIMELAGQHEKNKEQLSKELQTLEEEYKREMERLYLSWYILFSPWYREQYELLRNAE